MGGREGRRSSHLKRASLGHPREVTHEQDMSKAAQKVRSFSAAVTGAEGHLGTLLLGPESQVHRPRYVTVST